MRLKLDENLGTRGRSLFEAAGHDVMTVADQHLQGTPDDQLVRICTNEGRALVTLDLDFSNAIRFPPSSFCGIAVLRMPARLNPSMVDKACEMLIATIERSDLTGKLWVVERDRVREYRPDDPDVNVGGNES